MFQNQWFVGIVGGIISGIIVYFITQWIFKRKDNSKYLEQINSANNEVIRALKPYVAEIGLPKLEIITAIAASLSRKYNIEQSEMISIRVICEELIKEVIENVYVSSDKKKEYTENLNSYLLSVERDLNKDDLKKSLQNQENLLEMKKIRDFKSKYFMYTSSILAIFTCAVSIIGFLYSQGIVDKDLTAINITDTNAIILGLPILMILTATTVVFTSRFGLNIHNFFRINEEKSVKNGDDKANKAEKKREKFNFK